MTRKTLFWLLAGAVVVLIYAMQTHPLPPASAAAQQSSAPKPSGPVTARTIRTVIEWSVSGKCDEVVSYIALWRTTKFDGCYVRRAIGARYVFSKDLTGGDMTALSRADAQTYDITCPE